MRFFNGSKNPQPTKSDVDQEAYIQRPVPAPEQISAPKEVRKPSLNQQVGSAESRTGTHKRSVPLLPAAPERVPKEEPINGPPSDTEKRWAEEKLIDGLQAKESNTDKVSQQSASDKPEKTPPKKKRKSLGRTHQIMTRLTDAEMTKLKRRVKESGLAQGDYLRSMALTGEIRIEERNMVDVAALTELAALRAELGRQGGLLKMVIRPNEGQRELAPDEWAELIGTIRNMEGMKKRLSDLEVKIIGNHRTSNK